MHDMEIIHGHIQYIQKESLHNEFTHLDNFVVLQSTLMEASKGVTEGTNNEYRRCDSIKLDSTNKPLNQEHGTYGHAQKMRASMTYAFGRLSGLGNMPWHKSDIGGGIMVGNPSISVEVSSYMCSLRRCKVKPSPLLFRCSQKILLKLYHHNHLPENWTLLQAAYTVAFLCMLRFDEVFKIQVHDLYLIVTNLCTHQYIDIKPFNLWALSSSEAHLCPVRALSAWLCESKITSGYLFWKVASGDWIAEANSPMSSEQFLELFCNNLLDISIDPAPYGTHSFHRGGCQYLHVERHWPLRRICEWGGWSTEFTNMTIVKYLILSNDDPTEPRTQFFNPNRHPTVKCPQCGRCCCCG
ncbi:hypothetical protein BDR03DRAFT_930434 [Suillus americanus]|nr:hypothetical protein BDR03DRAFT_930434 [Suillus americanus]